MEEKTTRRARKMRWVRKRRRREVEEREVPIRIARRFGLRTNRKKGR